MPLASDWEPERADNGVPCACGGFAGIVRMSYEEIEARARATRACPCCIRVVKCRVCADEFVVDLPAPEMDY